VSAQRVVLLDPWAEVADAEPALVGLQVRVEKGDAIPQGSGVVALVAGPDWHVGAAEAAALPDLRIVATPSTGFDHLDVGALAAAGVVATHVAGYCDDEVAEHALAMALDLLRGVSLLDRDVRAGGWDYAAALPRRVGGATLGIVGLGRIGRQLAWRAAALGMRVTAFDPALDAAAVRAAGAEPCATLHELMASADVVSLHAFLGPATEGLIDAAALAAARPGTYLVNCARAGLVDQAALGEALRSGHLGGAALDVLPVEPPVAGEPALTWPRVVLNPHAAWYSPATAAAPYRIAAQAVAAVLRGDQPLGLLRSPSDCI
jgi:phosphoglycerate dehydrogenase-like enzyme